MIHLSCLSIVNPWNHIHLATFAKETEALESLQQVTLLLSEKRT